MAEDYEEIEKIINSAFENPDDISPDMTGKKRDAIETAMSFLDNGTLRVAEKNETWRNSPHSPHVLVPLAYPLTLLALTITQAARLKCPQAQGDGAAHRSSPRRDGTGRTRSDRTGRHRYRGLEQLRAIKCRRDSSGPSRQRGSGGDARSGGKS